MLKKLIAKLCPKKKPKAAAIPTPGLTPSKPLVFRDKKGLRVANYNITARPGEVGILIINCPGAVIEHNVISGGRTCIQVEDSPGVAVSNNTLYGYANAAEEGHGIQFRRSSGTITHNSINRWGKTGKRGLGEDAINLYESMATVHSNSFLGHGQDAGNAVTVDLRSRNCHVYDNTIIDAGPRGIVFTYGAGHTCRNNRFVRGCHDAAVAVDRECYQAAPIQVKVTGSLLESTKGSGIVYVLPNGQESMRA